MVAQRDPSDSLPQDFDPRVKSGKVSGWPVPIPFGDGALLGTRLLAPAA